MASVADTIRLAVLHAFGWLLPAALLAWLCAVLGARGLSPLGAARRAAAALPPAGRAAFCALLALCLVRGATKSGGARAPLRSPRPAGAVSPEDVARGWRAARDGAEGPVEMPPGAETNDLLRRRGGFDWAFRVEPAGWRFPYRGGVLRGVTVLARGEVRPDAGSRYFPVPFQEGVSLLPESRLGLLPGGGASVFRHAVTAGGSLLLDWRGALVGRDPNAATNLQMELFPDGRFAWRTDGGSRLYLPVLPFDWDGDGLENAVDPEPLVPHPADAHGANAEWYAVVCSNVFERTARPEAVPVPLPCGDEVFFRTNAAARAYYFVEAVASEGPAPIRFEADRASRLGSPVVVARAGETNLVPLLVGVGYAVSSPVPFSLSAPGTPFAEIERRNAGHYEVRLPLGFEFAEFPGVRGRDYAVSVVPCDPGGTFTWGRPRAEAASAPLSTTRYSPCTCCSGAGNVVSFNCPGSCFCGGDCVAVGAYRFEGVEFSVTGGVCRCGFNDPPHEDEPHHDPAAEPSLSIRFSKPTVIFEEPYQDSPGVWSPRRSTRVRLTVSAFGGPNGGTLTLNPRNLDRLSEVAEGPISLPTTKTLASGESFHATCIYEARRASDSLNDISVAGSFMETGTEMRLDRKSTLTALEIELRAAASVPDNKRRHVFGPLERTLLLMKPAQTGAFVNSAIMCSKTAVSDGTRITLTNVACSASVSVQAGSESFPLFLKVIEPSPKILARNPIELPNEEWLPCLNERPLDPGEAGVAWKVRLSLAPSYVSFKHLRVVEEDAPAMNIWGCCSDASLFPPSDIAHMGTCIPIDEGGPGVVVNDDNSIGDGDRVAAWASSALSIPCTAGGYRFLIPVKWYTEDRLRVQSMGVVEQKIVIEPNGTVKVSKFGFCGERTLSGQFRVSTSEGSE